MLREQAAQVVPGLLLEGLHGWTGRGYGGQDALDGLGAERPVLEGTLEGADEVAPAVDLEQREDAAGLLLSASVAAQEPIEEVEGRIAEGLKAFAKEGALRLLRT